jgi:hypothetical protein
MGWKITIDFPDDRERFEIEIPTPNLHIAVDSALYKAGIAQDKTGSVQITAHAA